MKKTNIRKLAMAAVLVAVAVVGSLFSFPFLGAKCSPVQHLVNIIGGVYLGPWYSLGVAFCASLLRNIFGLGSLMAFPGSMVGAFLSGVMFHWIFKGKPLALRLPMAYVGELFGTSVIGGHAVLPDRLSDHEQHRCNTVRIRVPVLRFQRCGNRYRCYRSNFAQAREGDRRVLRRRTAAEIMKG